MRKPCTSFFRVGGAVLRCQLPEGHASRPRGKQHLHKIQILGSYKNFLIRWSVGISDVDLLRVIERRYGEKPPA